LYSKTLNRLRLPPLNRTVTISVGSASVHQRNSMS